MFIFLINVIIIPKMNPILNPFNDSETAIDKNFDFDKYLKQFEDFYHCGEKKSLFCDKDTLMNLKVSGEIEMLILLVNTFIKEVEEKIIHQKKLKDDAERMLVRLTLDPNRSSNEINIMKDLMDDIEQYNSNIKSKKIELVELKNFEKFIEIFDNR
uniref:Uncharacterized protein n=1 Tax=Borely moumouvirus TaxID=2712067 RepID=A0A6G6ADY5_9VIRU